MKIKSYTLVQTYHRTLSAHENGMAANIFFWIRLIYYIILLIKSEEILLKSKKQKMLVLNKKIIYLIAKIYIF